MDKIPYSGYRPLSEKHDKFFEELNISLGGTVEEAKMLKETEVELHRFFERLIRLADKHGNADKRNALVAAAAKSFFVCADLYDFTEYQLPTLPNLAAAAPAKTDSNKTSGKFVRKSRNEALFGADAAKTQQSAEKPKEGVQMQGDEWTGHLFLRCDHCKNEVGFYTKYVLSYNRCKECGGKTYLKEAPRRAFVTCECGRKFRYKTNIDEKQLTVNCHVCGTPVELEKDRSGNAYKTIL